MRPQLSPSNPGTMSSKEREWLEQRASYSLETEGGMEGWEPRWGEGGDEGWWEWCKDTSLTMSQRGRLPGKRGCASLTPLDISAQLCSARAHSHKLGRQEKKKKSVGGYGAATSQLHPISMQTVTMWLEQHMVCVATYFQVVATCSL